MSEDVSHIKSLILIAGLSGAGKSSASRALSDRGFYAIDNLPVSLLPNVLALSRRSPERFERTSLLVDIHEEDQLQKFFSFLQEVDTPAANVNIVFLEASTDTLIRRYSETRRPHPSFDHSLDNTLEQAILRERAFLAPVREKANLIIDTSELTIHDLRRKVSQASDSFAKQTQQKLRINFVSFGFKYGLPPDCNLVIDVRFLPNPHFEPGLRARTGLEEEVSDFVFSQEDTSGFLDRFHSLLEFLLPRYLYEGKAYLNIGIGCTGGKHRSVALAQKLSERVSGEDFLVSVVHRDIERSL